MDSLEHWTQYTRFVVALIAVLDPFMAVPVFLTVSAGRPEAARRRLAGATSLTVLIVLVGASLVGESTLRVMGTSFASFQTGGGLVLLLMSLAMLQARPGDIRQTPEEANEAEMRDTSGIVPLAIPVLAGPGAISTVMIAAQHGGWMHKTILAVTIAGVCLILWIVLQLAIPIGRMLGATGLNIANRLLGLLLAAIAIESMAAGLRALFPALMGG